MSTFDYFGQTFSYAEEFPAFEYAEFCEALADGEDSENARATGVALRLAVASVAEKDRARFRQVSRKNHAKVEDWLTVFRDYTAGEAERPTGQPTDSSGGQEGMPPSSGSQPTTAVTSQDETVRPIRGDLALALSRSA